MPRSTLPEPCWLSFDCYGTLIDWEAGVRRFFREVMRVRAEEEAELFAVWERKQWERLLKPYTPYASILQASVCEAVEQFGYACPAHAAEAFVESVARWQPFPEVGAALMKLSPRYKLAIISNIDRELLGRTLRHFSVRFDALITAEDARVYKPNAEIFLYALAKLNCGPKDILHVAFGSEYDLAPASRVGFRVAYVDRGAPPPEDLLLEAELKSLEELTELWPLRDNLRPQVSPTPRL